MWYWELPHSPRTASHSHQRQFSQAPNLSWFRQILPASPKLTISPTTSPERGLRPGKDNFYLPKRLNNIIKPKFAVSQMFFGAGHGRAADSGKGRGRDGSTGTAHAVAGLRKNRFS
jgi:hypothetical protein